MGHLTPIGYSMQYVGEGDSQRSFWEFRDQS